MPKRSDVKRLQKYILSAPKNQQTGDLQNRRIQHQLNYTTNFAHAAYIACSTIIVEQIDQKWIEMQKLNMIKNHRRKKHNSGVDLVQSLMCQRSGRDYRTGTGKHTLLTTMLGQAVRADTIVSEFACCHYRTGKKISLCPVRSPHMG